MTETRGGPPFGEPPDIRTREEFAAALTALRTRAGLSVRTLAQALKTPTATIGDYCSGRHLPGPRQQGLFSEMLRMVGVEEEQVDGWLELVARLRAGSDGRVRRVTAPYQGLAPFDAEDRERFFGREATTGEILQRLRGQAAGTVAAGLLLVVGSSGAGKSSLLRAGVQAQIDAGALADGRGWSTCLFSPGEKPLETLHSHLAQLPQHDRVVIVDQLEEIFAVDTVAQERFLEELAQLATAGTLVLGGLRADFYEQAVRVPALLDSLRADPVLLGPMTEVELRSAIIGPAEHAGAEVEDGLVELLIADLAPREATGFAHDAGSLPLLSHALLQSWERARGNRVTIADYRASGGLRGAVSQTAEQSYTQLTATQQQLARRMFMRLVRVPKDGPAVRRRARRHELDVLEDADGQQPADGAAANAVVDRFVAARLMTVGTDTVELSHDALLTAWPRLATWIEQNRDGLRLHRLLTDACDEWIAAGRDQALLLREARLQLVGEWAGEPENLAELNADERAYLSESQELAVARRRAVRRRARQMRLLITASLALAAIAVVLAVVALHASDTATRARNDALSRQIALQAASVAPTNASLAMQLAVLAHKVAATTDATSALLDVSDGESPTRVTGPTGPAFLSTAPAADLLAVAYSAADRIRIYSLSAPIPRLRATVAVRPASGQVFAVALSPGGRLLAAGGTDHQVTVWSLSRPAHPSKLATLSLPAGTVYALAFSPNGRQLAAVNATRRVELWSMNRHGVPQPETSLTAPGNTALRAVQFSPGGQQLAAAGSNGYVAIWRHIGRGARPVSIRVSGAPTFNVLSFSPTGQTLAVGGTDDVVHRWNLTGAGAPVALASLHGFTSWIESLTFSPTGRELAAGSSDNSLRVWSTATPGIATILEHPAPVTGIVFASHGTRLVTVDAAGTLRAWTLPPPATRSAPGKIFGLDYTSDGTELAVISSGPNGDAQLWNTAAPTNPTLITNIPAGSFGAVAGAGAITGDGKLLAIANAHAQVRLLDVTDPRAPRPIGPLLTGATPYVEQMTFDPNGRLLAAGDDAGHIHLWNTANPNHPVSEPTLNLHAPPQIMLGVAFSPNGRLLASASTSGRVALWDVEQPNHPRLLATAGHLKGYAYTVAFTPDGRTLIAAGSDRTIHVWNISNPTHPQPIGNPLTGPTSTIYSIAVNANGSRLAAATTNGNVWLWNIKDPANPQQIADLAGSTSELYTVSFQPHSNTLVAGGTDQELHLWDDNPAELTKRICKIAGTPLTRAEWTQYVESGQYAPPCGDLN